MTRPRHAIAYQLVLTILGLEFVRVFMEIPSRLGRSGALAFLLGVVLSAALAGSRWRASHNPLRPVVQGAAALAILFGALLVTALDELRQTWLPERAEATGSHDPILALATSLLTLVVLLPLLNDALIFWYLLQRARTVMRAAFAIGLVVLVDLSAGGVDATHAARRIVTGVVLGIIMLCTHRLWMVIATHALIQLAALASTMGPALLWRARFGVAYPIACAVLAVASASAVYHALRLPGWTAPDRRASDDVRPSAEPWDLPAWMP